MAFITIYFMLLRRLCRRKTSERKTILIMVYSLYGGGAQRVATVLASELAARYRVLILTFKPDSRHKTERCGQFPINPEVEIIALPSSLQKYDDTFKRLARWIRTLKRIERVYASISFLYWMNYLNVESKANEKTICSERNNPTKQYFDRQRLDQIRSNYRRADHVVFQSRQIRDIFADEVGERFSILPNPVSVECERKQETRKRIVTVGRLALQKNHAMLIRAFHRFHQTHPEYTLSVYGAGLATKEPHPYNQEEPLKNLVAELDLQDSVIFEGSSPQVHRDIADAEFFVLSSDYEGLSNALLEAMTMGFPCVSTDCEGSTDVIENGVNGLLVPRGDEDALLNAMLTLAEQEDYRESLGRQAKKTAERFKRERVAQEWAEMIERI